MKIAVPREIEVQEYRVGLVPGGAALLIGDDHDVFVESGAGVGSGIPDEAYEEVGCRVLPSTDDTWASGDLVVKVRKPTSAEYPRIRRGQIISAYFHLAAAPELARVLVEREATAVAYETIQLPDGSLPLLRPMSEVAGRMSVQVGARCLEKEYGGRGVLLGGVTGVSRGKVVILGGGTVGTEAAKIAVGMGAHVTVLDIDIARLQYLDDVFGNRLQTLFSNPPTVREEIHDADLVVGAVLIPGARTPRLVTEEFLKEMRPGAVVVDVSVDQGGCVETGRPTTHDDPTYIVHDVVHYCVVNMPGAVSRTSTYALTNATLEYERMLANLGFAEAVRTNPTFARGVNTHAGCVTHEAVGRALGTEHRALTTIVGEGAFAE